jgi:hypothetical protein
MDSTYSDAVGHWHAWTTEHTAELLTNAMAHACAHIANETIHECIGEIARLRAEIDRYRGYTVHHCTEAQMDSAAAQLALDAARGDILRATDTGREWQFQGGGQWAERGRH